MRDKLDSRGQTPPESFRYISESLLESIRGLADIPSGSMKILTALSLSVQSLHSSASNVEHGPSLTSVLQSRSLLLGMSRYRHSPFRIPTSCVRILMLPYRRQTMFLLENFHSKASNSQLRLHVPDRRIRRAY